MQKVKIVSSWTNPGGSTVAHINLCNLLNENGYDCTFYGPHDWHLDKCKGAKIQELEASEDDIIISHYLQPVKLPCKHILYCHEKDIYPLKQIDTSVFDFIVYVSNDQRAWHGINHPYKIIPPVVEEVRWIDPTSRIAGVIGSVDNNKQTHVSIEKALEDGYEKIYLFGEVTDLAYFNEYVSPWVSNGKAVLMGHEDDKEKMYGMVDAVYHASKSETFGLVEAECLLAGIPYNGPKFSKEIIGKEEILERWESLLI